MTPQDWAAFSNANIDKAERERNSSVALRASIDSTLKQTTDDMKKQCEAVNIAFRERLAEMKRAKEKLEQHLDKVSQQCLVSYSRILNSNVFISLHFRASAVRFACFVMQDRIFENMEDWIKIFILRRSKLS